MFVRNTRCSPQEVFVTVNYSYFNASCESCFGSCIDPVLHDSDTSLMLNIFSDKLLGHVGCSDDTKGHRAEISERTWDCPENSLKKAR